MRKKITGNLEKDSNMKEQNFIYVPIVGALCKEQVTIRLCVEVAWFMLLSQKVTKARVLS